MKILSFLGAAGGLLLAAQAQASVEAAPCLPGMCGGGLLNPNAPKVSWSWRDGANGEGDGGEHASGTSTGRNSSDDGRFNTQVELAPIPYLWLDMTSGGNGTSFGDAQIKYNFTVTAGPDLSGDRLIASLIDTGSGAIGLGVYVTGSYYLQADGISKGLAIVDGGYGGNNLNAVCQNGNTDGYCGMHTFGVGARATLGTNANGFSTLSGTITLAIGADFNPYDSGHVIAFLDPRISLDPSIDPSLYTVTLSDGMANTTGANMPTLDSDAPEPATWTMMAGGFGLVGSQLRRRKPRRNLANA